MRRRLLVATAAVALAVAAAAPAAAQTVYLAFGDSITFGSFDPRPEKGYPPRLEQLLADRGVPAVVENHGVPGETTAEGLSRIDSVLAGGGDVLLLMEGTNDVNLKLSPETIRFNLDQIASRAEAAGLEVVHATVIPRLPSANYDGMNTVTRDLAGEIRELAWERSRNLADPFEVFFRLTENAFSTLYTGGEDKLHPNAAGYDLLAEIWADVLTGVDSVPPVIGHLSPYNDQQDTPPGSEIQMDLYDFGAGIAVGQTELLIDGEPVPATLSGDERRQLVRYQAPDPWKGVVYVGLSARDRASPPNAVDGTLLQFVVAGTQFLAGDITRDGRVDGYDLVGLAMAFGSRKGSSRYQGYADLDDDGFVDGSDLAILASNFGKSSF